MKISAERRIAIEGVGMNGTGKSGSAAEARCMTCELGMDPETKPAGVRNTNIPLQQ